MRQIAARVELHAIPSLTLSDEEFLKGRGGKPVTVAGELRVAPGHRQAARRDPGAWLERHRPGHRALDPRAERHGDLDLRDRRLHRRGLVTVGSDQAKLGRLNLALDAYRALAILAKHPRVDPNRIALMGFSRGGQAALYASVKRFDKLWNKSGAHFAAHVAFYPDCMTTYQADIELMPVPVRIYHGIADDYNPVRALPRLREAAPLPRAGRGAHRVRPGAPRVRQPARGAPSPRRRRTRRRCASAASARTQRGLLINTQTKQRFSYTDACVERDPHTGFYPRCDVGGDLVGGEIPAGDV
jgi:predicted esterase